nr:IclR family transcriptional regulator C-terminal domain-containing protein [Ruegeria lacuscaerulensis]
MQASTWDVGESLHLSLLEKDSLLTALVVETTCHNVRVSLDPSEIPPIDATASGLCVLSFGLPYLLDPLAQEEHTRYTNTTLTDPTEIKELVATVSQTGWANSNGSYENGVYGYAAPNIWI